MSVPAAMRPDRTLVRDLERDALRPAAGELWARGHRLALVAAHDDPDGLRMVYAFVDRAADTRTELVVRAPQNDPWVPSLAALSFPAGRFEREVRDLFGIIPRDHLKPSRLVKHAHWPHGWHPMRRDAGPAPSFEADVSSFPFLEVEGEGVYEIPVGPVHAGLIEPGHFRFSVVGETILRMKARLWFVHRGVERLFQGRPPDAGIELAERISGDTAVGHSLAYVMAVEGAGGIEVAPVDRVLRALLLELERLHNHVADIGALANDVGLGIVNVHAQRLRETLLRVNQATTGHRLLRGGLTIGGARVRALPEADVVAEVAAQTAEIVAIALDNAVVADRFTGTAVLPQIEATTMGVLGYVARGCGLDVDARRDHPFVDLGEPFRVVTHDSGDVLARFLVRAEEVVVSTALVHDLLRRLSGGTGTGAVAEPRAAGAGLALVEAWRGTLCHRVEIGTGGLLERVKVVDPSFFTWPGLPVALADTIVPDFPLANKSFNQSYAGNDL